MRKMWIDLCILFAVCAPVFALGGMPDTGRVWDVVGNTDLWFSTFGGGHSLTVTEQTTSPNGDTTTTNYDYVLEQYAVGPPPCFRYINENSDRVYFDTNQQNYVVTDSTGVVLDTGSYS